MDKTIFWNWILLCFILSTFGCKHDPIEPALPTSEICFQDQILPIIQSNCAKSGCHDAITAEEDLTLTDYSNIRNIVKPGDPSESDLYEVLTKSQGSEKFMPPPPNTPLNTSQITLIYAWIIQGANNNTCASTCDSTIFTFSGAVLPTIQLKCTGCHSGSLPSGNINLQSYGQIVSAVNINNLYGRISNTTNPMPPTGIMEACKILQIKKWIDIGKPKN